MADRRHEIDKLLLKIEQYVGTLEDVLEDYNEETEELNIKDEVKLEELKQMPIAITRYIGELRKVCL